MRSLALAVLLLSAVALAEEDGGVSPPVATPVPLAPVEPTPAAPPSVLATVLAAFRPYALLKPTVIVSSGGVESFSQPNASAITAAGNPVLATQADEARFTFQVAQSRAGLWLNEQGAVRGHLELDFIDFAKASPTVASLPRLRIARLDWRPSEHFMLSAGQDWDLHAPVGPHGSNLVGVRFLSGNTGFMRQQVKAIGTVGRFELAGAVGMPGVNVTAKDGAFELGVPTFAVRGAWLLGAHGRVGVSGIATSLRVAPGSATERRTLAGGVTAFGDVTVGRTTVRGELTLGRNMGNLGLLALSYGAAQDVGEWGGFLSVRHGFTDRHFVYATAGLARVLDRGAVVPSYAYATRPTDGSAPPMSTAALAGTGAGILHNAGATLGYELRLSKQLAFLLEGYFLQTEHRLQDLDVARVDPTRRAFGGELAAVVSF